MRAFTITELLVSLTIIAILLGALAPALSRSRRAAQNARCTLTLSSLTTLALFEIEDANSTQIQWPPPALPPHSGKCPFDRFYPLSYAYIPSISPFPLRSYRANPRATLLSELPHTVNHHHTSTFSGTIQ